jgi:glycosyltransferase involved in cell wall biosynthesis
MSPDRVRTIHDAIDTDHFSPSAVDQTRVRQEFGFATDVIIIGFVGRFSPGKGHEEFLQAAQILHTTYPNVRFLIVGEASHGEEQYQERIHGLCQQLGVGKVVKFAGFRTDIPQVMAAFDIFAFPSHAESFGVALIEAMAMERPVVSTNCDGVLDIVVEGETGIHVPPRNARELAEALARLIKDSGLRERMGKAGRKRVLALFNRKRQMETIEEVYYDLLGIPPQAGSEAQVISGTVPS